MGLLMSFVSWSAMLLLLSSIVLLIPLGLKIFLILLNSWAKISWLKQIPKRVLASIYRDLFGNIRSTPGGIFQLYVLSLCLKSRASLQRL